MRTHQISTLFAAAALAAAASATSTAQAQNLPLDRFVPAPAGDRMFGVESPFVNGHLTPHVMVMMDYAHNPLVLRNETSDKTIGSIVSSQMYLHLNGSFALWNRLNINLDVPIAIYQNGDSPAGGGTAVGSPSKAQFGDLRLGARVRLIGEYDDAFQLAIGGYVWFPTGPTNATGSYVGDGKVRGLPELILGGKTDRIVWSFAAGPYLTGADKVANVDEGIQVKTGAGIGVLLGSERQMQLGPEASVAFTPAHMNKRTFNSEVLVDFRYRFLHDFEAGAGIGPGLSGGVGTPDFRAIAMLAYTPEHTSDRDHDGIPDRQDACPDVPGVRNDDPAKNGCPPPNDRDHDGIVDELDACPDVPGVPSEDPKKNGCPLPNDRDHDGIPDEVDACPDVPGVANADPKLNGCPPDRDGDGIYDDVDACPDVKGVASPDPKKNGCPSDRDGDGIIDDLDACPDEPGPADPDPTKNGCPTVHLRNDEIVILEQVQFDTGKSTIKPVSDALLDKVAAVFNAHPEIRKVEVQGHTDNKGAPALNKTLSHNRAEAVKKALEKRGIAAIRLRAKGYGQDVPIADNNTDAGRALNRRVQFKVVEKLKAGESAPPAPPPPPPARKGGKKK